MLGEDAETIRRSPQLEGYAKRGVEVLLLSDPVDAFWVRSALGYDGKPFQSVTQGAATLDAIPLPEGAEANEAASEGAVATLAARFKQMLGDRVNAVRASSRLTTSPVCLVASDFGMDRQLEKFLSAQDQLKARSAPVLELNPTHPLIRALADKAVGGDGGEAIDDAAVLLYGEARILDGEAPEDPVDFAGRIARLIERGLK